MRTFAVALLLIAASTSATTAGATELPVPYGAEMAVTDGYAYWIAEKPKGCKKCDDVRRTRLSDGRTSLVLRVHRGWLGELRANGNTAVVTVSHGVSVHRSSVFAMNDAGSRRVLARGTYRMWKKGRCGTMVAAGAISQTNEVSWQEVSVGASAHGCAAEASKIRLSFHAGAIDGAPRVLMKPRALHSDFFFNPIELIQDRAISGFNGSQLLLDNDERGIELRDLATSRKFLLGKDYEYLGGSARLSSTGLVAADFWMLDDDGATTLFTNPTQSQDFRDISIGGDEGDFDSVRFCGAYLIQVVSALKGVSVIRRDLSGTELGRSSVRTKRYIDSVTFECNSSLGVLRYSQLSASGRNIKPVSTTIAIPQ